MLEIQHGVEWPVEDVREAGHLREELRRRWPSHFPGGPSWISERSTSNS
jgi:hypothetical protein